MDHIEDETLDMGSIVVCVCHNHQAPVSKFGDTCVLLSLLETQDLLEIIELLVRSELCNRDISDILALTPKWEYTVMIPTNNRETGNSEGLRRITLCDDESTLPRLCRTSLVRVIQFGDPGDLGFTRTVCLCKFLHLLELRECQEFISDTSLESILHKVLRRFKLTSKTLRLRSTFRLYLTRDGWIL